MYKRKTDTDAFTSLYMYGDEGKADALLSNIYSSVLTQIETRSAGGKDLSGGIKSKVNSALEKLGLPEIELEVQGKISHENAKSFVSAINFDSKVKILVGYWKKNLKLPYINLYDGTSYYYENNKRIDGELILDDNPLGIIAGTFTAKRIFPPSVTDENLGFDIRNIDQRKQADYWNARKKEGGTKIGYLFAEDPSDYLWNLFTVQKNKIYGEVPIRIGNYRRVSQLELLSLLKFKEYNMEVIGVLHKNDEKIICDPLAIQLLI